MNVDLQERQHGLGQLAIEIDELERQLKAKKKHYNNQREQVLLLQSIDQVNMEVSPKVPEVKIDKNESDAAK
jgi:hypothetical protein